MIKTRPFLGAAMALAGTVGVLWFGLITLWAFAMAPEAPHPSYGGLAAILLGLLTSVCAVAAGAALMWKWLRSHRI
ncbi:MAG: hypothetical protein EBR82_01815 [Caulobacteraceae bacterium]|nr:hypothetical protein [Caulobacteraceae bacterium]